MLTRDNERIIGALRNILAVDPSDRDAAAQLKEYTAKQASVRTESKKKANDAPAISTRTAAQYKKLRAALMSNNLTVAYDLLSEIVQLDPADSAATQQRREVGERLAKSEMPALQNILNEGNMPALTEKVATMRRWAKEDYLQSLDGWQAAAKVVDLRRAKEVAAELLVKFDALKVIRDLETREKTAAAIEKFSVENMAVMNPEQQRIISSIHQEWRAYLHQQELEARYEELQAQYQQIRDEYKAHQNAVATLEALSAFTPSLSELATEMDAGELQERVVKFGNRLRGEIKDAQRAKMIKRLLRSAAIVLVLGLAGATYYAYHTIGERSAKLALAVEGKDPVLADSLVNDNKLLVFLSRQVDSVFSAMYEDVQKWLAEWNNDKLQLEKYTLWLKELGPRLNVHHFEQNHREITKIVSFVAAYEKKYQDSWLANYKLEEEKFFKCLARLKPVALKKCTPSAQIDSMEELHDLHELSKACSDLFTEEDHHRLNNEYRDAARRILLPQNSEDMTEAFLRNSMAQYDKYAKEFDLSPSVKERLAELLGNLQWLSTIDAQLAQAENLNRYYQCLSANQDAYAELNGVSLYDLQHLRDNTDEYVRKKATELFVERYCAGETVNLELACDVYLKNAEMFERSRPFSANAVIDKMTLPVDSKNWSNRYDWFKSGNTVYVGTFSSINNEEYVRAVNGEKQRVGANTGATQHKKSIRLKDVRLSMGFKRMDLQRGKLTPAYLMESVIRYDDSHCPVMAKAYMYGLAIEFGEAFNDSALAGVAFSPTMQKDIAEYKRLAAMTKISNGCWMRHHRAHWDDLWSKFFTSVQPHDYVAEIKKCLGKVAAGGSGRFVGFINGRKEQCMTVRITEGEKLFVLSGRSLKPLEEVTPVPYAPIIAIKID